MKFQNAQQVFRHYIPGYIPPKGRVSDWGKEEPGIDCKEIVDRLLQELPHRLVDTRCKKDLASIDVRSQSQAAMLGTNAQICALL